MGESTYGPELSERCCNLDATGIAVFIAFAPLFCVLLAIR